MRTRGSHQRLTAPVQLPVRRMVRTADRRISMLSSFLICSYVAVRAAAAVGAAGAGLRSVALCSLEAAVSRQRPASVPGCALRGCALFGRRTPEALAAAVGLLDDVCRDDGRTRARAGECSLVYA